MTHATLPTRTPGCLYFVQQRAKGSLWRVIQISKEQGCTMQDRRLCVYRSSAQAHAVARGLNVRLANAPAHGACLGCGYSSAACTCRREAGCSS